MDVTPNSLAAAPARRDLPAAVPEAPATTDSGEVSGEVSGEDFWGEDGFTFGDILDLINPFHHVPVVSTLYRAATDDDISIGARLLGGALFGGIIGLFGAIFSTIVESATGKDLGEHVLALFEDAPPEPGDVAAATAPLNGEPVASTSHAAFPPDGEVLASTIVAPPPLWLARTPRARVDFAAVAAHHGSPAAVDWVLDALDESLDTYQRMQGARDAYERRESDVVATRLDATL